MSYQTDTLETIYNELEEIETELYTAALATRELAEDEARTIADYEGKKSTFLLQLAAEEARDGIKRTEAIRTAMYREKYADERFERDRAGRLLKAHLEYLKGLSTVLNSRQSRLRVLEAERRASNATA